MDRAAFLEEYSNLTIRLSYLESASNKEKEIGELEQELCDLLNYWRDLYKVIELPHGISEEERAKLANEVFPFDVVEFEEGDYWCWALSNKSTWDDYSQSEDKSKTPYEPKEIISPMWTGSDSGEICRAVAQWYRNNTDKALGAFLWGHLGRGWMCFGHPAPQHPFTDVNIIFSLILE